MHIYLFISLEIKNNYPAAIMYLITPLKKKKKSMQEDATNTFSLVPNGWNWRDSLNVQI